MEDRPTQEAETARGYRTRYLQLKSVLFDRTTGLPAFPVLFDRLREMLEHRPRIGVLHIEIEPELQSARIASRLKRRRQVDNARHPKLMEPGTVYEFTIDMMVTSNVFKKGHRIRLDITSSNFPLWDRNLNTGNAPATDTEMIVAEQTIYHDSARPSHVILPIIPA